MRIVFLIVFILSSLAHLYGSYIDDRRIRNVTKWIPLLSLVGYYVCSVKEPDSIVVVALVFSLLGDILLMFGKTGFAMGGISFALSHVFFVVLFLRNVKLPSSLIFGVVGALVLGAAIFAEARDLKDSMPKKLLFPMVLYLFANASTNCAALMQYVSKPGVASAVVLTGALFFFLSDLILFRVRFHRRKKVWRRHFLVMVTYLTGEFLLIQGIIMMRN